MPYVKMDQKQIYYDDFGEGNAILFIHPPGLGRKTFLKQLPLQLQYRLLIPDLSGHGDSFSPTSNMSVACYVEEVEAIRADAKVNELFLFGYSSGGMIAQEYAILYPEKVKGIILSGGFPKVVSDLFKAEHQIGIFMARRYPRFLGKVLSISHFKEKALQDALYHHVQKSNNSVWAQFYKLSMEYDCLHKLSQLHTPLLLLYGKKADVVNQHVRLYEPVKNKKVHFINKAGHQLPTRHADEVNRIIHQFVGR